MGFMELRNIAFRYAEEEPCVFEDFSMSVEEETFLLVEGDNGSGKTTLLRGISGLLSPKSGSIELCDGLTRNQIGYLPQITNVQKDFPASVEEIVLSAFQGKKGLLPFYKRAHRERAMECMALTRTESLRKACFRELSGGQRQRVLLARALCAAERLLLLDEPVTGLDPESTESMYRIISDLHKSGMTIIMVTHDLDAAHRESSRILDFDPIEDRRG